MRGGWGAGFLLLFLTFFQRRWKPAHRPLIRLVFSGFTLKHYGKTVYLVFISYIIVASLCYVLQLFDSKIYYFDFIGNF